jgi:hypothetical protein
MYVRMRVCVCVCVCVYIYIYRDSIFAPLIGKMIFCIFFYDTFSVTRLYSMMTG